MTKTVRLLFSTDKNLIPNTRVIEGTGIVILHSTTMVTGAGFFEYVIEYDPTLITHKGREVIESWREHAYSVEDLIT